MREFLFIFTMSFIIILMLYTTFDAIKNIIEIMRYYKNKRRNKKWRKKMIKCSICGKEVPQDQVKMNMETYQFECLNCIDKNSTKV